MPQNEAKRPVKTAQNLFDIFEHLLEQDGITVTELAHRTEFAKSTIHRYLMTLVDLGYVVKNGNQFNMGLKFLDYGMQVRDKYEILHAAEPELERVAHETGEVVWLVVEENGEAVYLDYRAGEHGVRTQGRIGKRSHLHYLAAGKAIMSQLSSEKVESIVEQWGLPAKTDNTITDYDDLLEILDQIRERGYAFNENEEIEGVRAVGAPITQKGGVLGGISIAGPQNRMKKDRFRETLPEIILDAANTIELKIEFD